jgi:citrate lyase beta subunit/acyl dehydratase
MIKKYMNNNIIIRTSLVLKPAENCYSKIEEFGADWYVLDMEDGVPVKNKDKVRNFVSNQLNQGKLKNFNIAVRLNGLEQQFELIKDLDMLVHPDVKAFHLPKINNLSDIEQFDRLVAKAEVKAGMETGYFRFMPILETPLGILNADSIAIASNRNIALILGHNDLLTEIYAVNSWENLTYARQKVVLAACSAGLEPIDSPYHKLDRPNGLMKECIRSKALGFSGKILLHPEQVKLTNFLFSPSLKEKIWAKKILSLVEDDISVFFQQNSERFFFGPPHIKNAKRIEAYPDGKNELTSESVYGVKPNGGFAPENIYQGAVVQSRFELTITETWFSLWNAAFFNTNRFNSSRLQATQIGLDDLIAPYMMVLTLLGSMVVSQFSESGKFHLGLKDVIYCRPLYAGDTLRGYFKVEKIEPTSTGNNSIVESSHVLINQSDEIVSRFTKITLFPLLKEITAPSSFQEEPSLQFTDSRILKEMIIRRFTVRRNIHPILQKPLKKGELLIHRFVKVFDASETRTLSTLLRLTNAHHYDTQRFEEEDVVVPGPFIIAASLSVPLHDLGDILYEEILHCSNINMVNFDDCIGSVSYIIDINSIEENFELEELVVKTLGIKNLDMNVLLEQPIPKELFSRELMQPSQYEDICKTLCPMLHHRIACQTVRKVIITRL